jgi:hypothetical protein
MRSDSGIECGPAGRLASRAFPPDRGEQARSWHATSSPHSGWTSP